MLHTARLYPHPQSLDYGDYKTIIVGVTMSAHNPYKKAIQGRDSLPGRAVAITPSDADELPHVVRTIYIGSGGDLTVIMMDDDTNTPVLFTNIAGGVQHAIAVKKVLATGTTCSNLVGLY